MPLTSKRRKIVWLGIPRTATTSMQEFLRNNISYDFVGHKHRPITRRAKGYYHYTFVRNPYDRMASLFGWYNKIKEADIKIEEFLDLMHKASAQITSKNNRKTYHWLTQTEYVFPNDLDDQPLFDFVGKYENLQEDLCKLQFVKPHHLESFPKLYATNSRTSLIHNNKDFIKLINEIYEEDFINFNYEKRNI